MWDNKWLDIETAIQKLLFPLSQLYKRYILIKMVSPWGLVSWSLLTGKGLDIQTEAGIPEGKEPKWKSHIPCWCTTAPAKTVLKRSTDSGMIPHFPISLWTHPFQLLHSSCWNDTLIQGSACPNKEPHRRRGGSISTELPKALSQPGHESSQGVHYREKDFNHRWKNCRNKYADKSAHCEASPERHLNLQLGEKKK